MARSVARGGILFRLLPLLLFGGCAADLDVRPVPPVSEASIGMLRPGLPLLNGYLKPTDLPDSVAIVPAPPAAGSAAGAADQAAFEAAMAASAERFALAAADADLRFPNVVGSYGAILGVAFDERTMPHTTTLVRRALTDAGLSTYAAKNRYRRTRPFVVNQVATCTPGEEAMLAQDGSYPSGHAAIGWMLALVLTDLVPAKATALLTRGVDFGQSRVVCRVHWQSDVEAGRLMASATFARLQAEPVYRAQRDLARGELSRALASGKEVEAKAP
jgi:acid phosphatase (class A)